MSEVRDKAGRRIYSDRERAEALAALDSADGSVRAASRATGIPQQTIRQWRDGQRGQVARDGTLIPTGRATRRLPLDPALRQSVKDELGDRFERLAFRLIKQTQRKVKDMSGSAAIIGAAVATDKMLLLRGDATTIVSTADAERLAVFRARYSTVHPATLPALVQEAPPVGSEASPPGDVP